MIETCTLYYCVCAVSVPVQEPVPAVCVWGHVRCGAQCGMRSPYSAVQCCTVQYRGASCGGQQCAAAIGWVGTGTCGDWRHWRPGESGAAGWRQQAVCSPLATPDQRGVLPPGTWSSYTPQCPQPGRASAGVRSLSDRLLRTVIISSVGTGQ